MKDSGIRMLRMKNVIMKLRCPKKHLFLVNHAIGTMFNHYVTTYPFAGERGEAHGCVFQRRKMRGVATNVYLWKT